MKIVFSKWKSNCGDMKFNFSDDPPVETVKASVAEDFAKLETELKDYAIQHEVFVPEVELTYPLKSCL